MPDEPATFELLPARGCRGERLQVTVGEPDGAGRCTAPITTVVGLWLTLSIPASLALFAVARPIAPRG